MKEYFISSRSFSNGYHFVHTHDCPLLPGPWSMIFLGAFQSPRDAVEEGRKHFSKPVCCQFCSKEDNWSKVKPESEVKAGTAFISSDCLASTIESLMFCSVS